jgi:hypothetical protein
LEGIRLALVNEIENGKKLRTDLLKQLVGGDAITARNPYERPRTYIPTHKIWMAGNCKPEIRNTDDGTWRRIHLVPWDAAFKPSAVTRDVTGVEALAMLRLPDDEHHGHALRCHVACSEATDGQRFFTYQEIETLARDLDKIRSWEDAAIKAASDAALAPGLQVAPTGHWFAFYRMGGPLSGLFGGGHSGSLEVLVEPAEHAAAFFRGAFVVGQRCHWSMYHYRFLRVAGRELRKLSEPPIPACIQRFDFPL